MLTPIVVRLLLLLACIAAVPLLFVASNPNDDAAWAGMTHAQRTRWVAWLASNAFLCVVYLVLRMAGRDGLKKGGDGKKMSWTSLMTLVVAAVFIVTNVTVLASRTFVPGEAARLASLILVSFTAGLALLNASFIVYNVRGRIQRSIQSTVAFNSGRIRRLRIG